MGTYTFIVYDNVGNSKIISINASNVDMRIPKIAITQKYTEWTNSDVQLHYKAEDIDTGIKEVVLPASGSVSDAEGNYIVTKNGVYTFIAYDKSGNGVIGRHEVSNIDKEKPELILTLSEDNTKIRWSISDSQSGFDYVVLPTGETVRSQSSGEFTITKSGTYTFIGYDKVGNYRIEQITRQ